MNNIKLDKEVLEAGRIGTVTGRKTGLVLAVLYVSAYIFYGIINLIISVTMRPNFDLDSLNFTNTFIFLVLFLVVGCAIGIVTAVPIGMLTGFILGAAISFFIIYLSKKITLILGTLIGLNLALIVFATFRSWDGYWIFIGIPSIIYTIACGWMSKKFYEDWVTGFTVKDQDFITDD